MKATGPRGIYGNAQTGDCFYFVRVEQRRIPDYWRAPIVAEDNGCPIAEFIDRGGDIRSQIAN